MICQLSEHIAEVDERNCPLWGNGEGGFPFRAPPASNPRGVWPSAPRVFSSRSPQRSSTAPALEVTRILRRNHETEKAGFLSGRLRRRTRVA